MLREMGTPGSNYKRGKPDIITIDDSRREPPSPNSITDMRFRPGPHHMVKQENMGDKEPNPSLTAGSLIDVIITRQISNASGRADQPGPPGGGPSQTVGNAPRPPQQPKRGETDTHKPFTLGEHIEQIITNDFSRKDSLASPVGGPMSGMTGQGPVGMVGFPQFQQRMDNSWKRRMNDVGQGMNNQGSPPQPLYTKPPSTQASTVEYEPISPPEREASDSGEDSQDNNGVRRPGL